MQNRMRAPEPAGKTQENEEHTSQRLGPFLCWAVVFADIGTSIYYVPGILYGTVGRLAGFFVLLTMIVFILLTFKYVEVTYRFPQGGGVVTVAARALNRWFGALGGMFILVDYFLTAAISCLSGMLYLSVVLPALGPQTHFLGQSITLWITLVILVLLGILNWVGVSESAKVSLIGAVIAFVSDIAILVTVFAHMSLPTFLGLFPRMFSGRAVTPILLLSGFAGSFLAFSGLESISQLSPVMKLPRRTVGKLALFLVILTVGLTSPLLTILSTLLLPKAAADPVLSSQIISLLGGRWGGILLQTEVAVSASALLIFASNTAIIGSYHVFLALSRMEFFPQFILQRNALRGTPHYSIAISTLLPIVVLLLVHGDINKLGDMYAFGLLGAFTLTCLSMDIVRYRERKARRREAAQDAHPASLNGRPNEQGEKPGSGAQVPVQDMAPERGDGQMTQAERVEQQTASSEVPEAEGRWTRSTLNFWLGILTTVLVLTAWSTNLVAKPLATVFGGSVALIGMGIAYTNATIRKRRGRVPVLVTGVEKDFPDAVLAVLTAQDGHNEAVMHAAVHNPGKKRVVFLYLGAQASDQKPELFRLVEPHLHDDRARVDLGRANHLAQEAGVECRFIYRHQEPDAAYRVWQTIQPREALVATEQAATLQQINPDRTYNERLPEGEVTHLVKGA
ncbi:MAG: APC family permease [Ktedonobacteraceae bacterium]|nr:APC family permease [Ktedonobacteraceae bacterium]